MIRLARIVTAASALTAGILPPAPASAACATCSCSVLTTSLSFGSYNPSNASPTSANATVTVTCTPILLIMLGTIDVSISPGSSGNALARTMANGTAKLAYNVYQDASYTTPWGTGGSNGSVQTFSILNLSTYKNPITAYGRIPALQWVKPGTYLDTLTITVSY